MLLRVVGVDDFLPINIVKRKEKKKIFHSNRNKSLQFYFIVSFYVPRSASKEIYFRDFLRHLFRSRRHTNNSNKNFKYKVARIHSITKEIQFRRHYERLCEKSSPPPHGYRIRFDDTARIVCSTISIE